MKYIKLKSGRILEMLDVQHQPDVIAAYTEKPYYEIFNQDEIISMANTKEELINNNSNKEN